MKKIIAKLATVLIVNALILTGHTTMADKGNHVKGKIIVGDEKEVTTREEQTMFAITDPSYTTGETLAAVLKQKMTITQIEKIKIKEGFSLGIVEMEVPIDVKLLRFVAKTYSDQRGEMFDISTLDRRSDTDIKSDEIKAELLGYVLGMALSIELDLDPIEAASMSLGLEQQLLAKETAIDSGLIKVTQGFISERIKYLSSVPNQRISEKVVEHLAMY